jgi:hypothetical protein
MAVDDAIVRPTARENQGGEFRERFDSDLPRTSRKRRTRHAIGHPDRDRGRARVAHAEPEPAPFTCAMSNANRCSVQRMPRIVDRYFLFSVVGGM